MDLYGMNPGIHFFVPLGTSNVSPLKAPLHYTLSSVPWCLNNRNTEQTETT
jgi:hypothetical protein